MARHHLNVLDEGTSVMGDINLAYDTRISCTILGDVHCEHKIIIDKQGRVEGYVFAREIIIEGTIEKDIYCLGNARLTAGSVVLGNLYVLSAEISPEAIFKGTMQITTPQEVTRAWETRNEVQLQQDNTSRKSAATPFEKQNENFLSRAW